MRLMIYKLINMPMPFLMLMLLLLLLLDALAFDAGLTLPISLASYLLREVSSSPSSSVRPPIVNQARAHRGYPSS